MRYTDPEDRTACPASVPSFHDWRRIHRAGRLWVCAACGKGMMAAVHEHVYLHDPAGVLKCVYSYCAAMSPR